MNRRDEGFWQKEERFSPEEREELLSERLRKFVRYAYERSRTFRRRLEQKGISPEEIRGLEDLEKLPLIRKEDLTEEQRREKPFGGFEAVPAKEAGRIYINPGLIFQPLEGEEVVKGWAEALFAAGVRQGDIVQNTFNYHLWPFAFTLDRALRLLGATVVPAGVENTAMQINIMRTLGVKAFVGTPSFLMTLAERAEAMGVAPEEIGLEVGFVTAEMLPEGLRGRLEEKWGMRISQGYGTVFTGCLGYECPERSGLHVPEGVIVEVVDPQTGKAVPPGAVGEIVATSFDPSFPMIRFATGDLSLLLREPCPCGRTSWRLKKILGRVDQATKVKGTFIHPWQTDEVASQFPEVFKYQVIITRVGYTDRMTFVAEVRDETVDKEKLRRRIERAIKETLTIRGEVEIVPAGSIPDWHPKIMDKRQWE